MQITDFLNKPIKFLGNGCSAIAFEVDGFVIKLVAGNPWFEATVNQRKVLTKHGYGNAIYTFGEITKSELPEAWRKTVFVNIYSGAKMTIDQFFYKENLKYTIEEKVDTSDSDKLTMEDLQKFAKEIEMQIGVYFLDNHNGNVGYIGNRLVVIDL